MNRSDRYDSLFQWYAEIYGVPWMLLKAQVRAESNFNPLAVSPVGAKGLAQFMPATWAEQGHDSPFNPEQSILAQAKYMAWLIEEVHGDYREALAAYNFGIGHVKAGKTWPLETIRYVDGILSEYNQGATRV